MSTNDLEGARYARMRWNTPLSQEHATLLLDRLRLFPGCSVLDLGCGWGELLLQAVAGASTIESPATGIGVDTDIGGLTRGRHLAAARGLDARVRFVEGPAAAWDQPAGRVLCVKASHAWGGSRQALGALADLVGVPVRSASPRAK